MKHLFEFLLEKLCEWYLRQFSHFDDIISDAVITLRNELKGARERRNIKPPEDHIISDFLWEDIINFIEYCSNRDTDSEIKKDAEDLLIEIEELGEQNADL